MKRNTIIGIVIALIAVAIFYTLFQNKQEIDAQADIKEEKFSIPVRTAIAKNDTISDALTATGEFRGWEEVTLVAESQGSIIYLKYQEGDKIRKGQTIAKIDAVSLNTQLGSARSAYAKAEKDVVRYERLEKVGAVSQSALEDARIQMENAQSNIAQINQQLGFTSVTSPIDGVVNDVMVEESSFVMPGDKIAQIVQIDRLKIEVNISERDLSKINEGQEVSIKTDVYPTTMFSGKVSNISVKADASRKYKVTIEVVNQKNKTLRAGMFAEVNFNPLESLAQNAIVIPRESIVGGLQNPSVYIVNDSIAHLKEIETGSVIDNNVVVLSGIEVGQQVVTKGIINLKDGTPVKIEN